MPAFRPLIALALLALPLAACKDKPKQATASGEILPGSVSDAMLPEDRLTSQPPLDPGAQRTGTRGADQPEATGTAEATAAAAEPPATAAAE